MRLGLGSGTGPRLLAPGLPDWIGADGAHVIWVQRDRLFVLKGHGVHLVELPDLVEDVTADPAGVVVALRAGFVRVDVAHARPVAVLLDDEADPVTTRPGLDVGLFVEVPSHRLLRLADGGALPLPDAATRARLIRPWARGEGAVWVDMDHLYRMGRRTEALARAPKATGLAVGPDGALLLTLEGDTLVAAPRQPAVRLGHRSVADSARFSPDGAQVLVADEEGVLLVTLATGKVEREWHGAFAPVGWAPAPRLLDLDRGALVDADGAVLLDGFARAGVATAGTVLVGPGGAVWDLPSGERRAAGLVDGVSATDGRTVVHADDHAVGRVGGTRHPHRLVEEDDEVAWVRLDGDDAVVGTLDDRVARVSLADGTVTPAAGAAPRPRPAEPGLVVAAADEPSGVTLDGRRVALPVDDGVRAGDGWWLWNDEGLLVRL